MVGVDRSYSGLVLYDACRNNAFEVVGVDGSYSGPVLCEDNRRLAEWLQAISSNTQGLLKQMVGPSHKIFFFGQRPKLVVT